MFETATKPEIITIGTVNVDLIMGPQAPWPQPGTEVILPHAGLREGGGAGITALALNALEVHHRMVVNVGQDVFGDWLASRYPGLTEDWIMEDTDTALTVGITHPDGERTFFSTPGHVAVFNPEDILQRLSGMALESVIILVVGTSLMPTVRPDLIRILKAVRERGGRIAIDTAWPTEGWTEQGRSEVYDWLPETDMLLLNEVEAAGLLYASSETEESGYQQILRRMPEGALFLTKTGARGARLDQLGKQPLWRSAEPIEVSDTIGAGDSFNAGFLAALARGHHLRECLDIATWTAAIAISADPRRYPSPEEVGLTRRTHPDRLLRKAQI